MDLREKLAPLRRRISEAMLHIYNRGLTTAAGGNISELLREGILITASGKHKGRIKEEDVLLIDPSGEVLLGNGKPSVEWRLHKEIYSNRNDVRAIIHAHPTFSTVIATCNLPYDLMTAESATLLERVSKIPYIKFGSEEFALAVAERIKRSNAILVERHGVIVVGKTLEEALIRLEALEENSKVLYLLRLVENVTS